MSDVKHTPGPWKAAPEANGEWGIDSATGWGIATVAGSAGPGPGDDESAANARLIAAAPELLETLQSLNAFVGVMVGRGPEATIPDTITTPLGVPVKIGEIMRDAAAALAKAEGRTP